MCFEVLLCATSFAFICCVSWCSCVSDFYCTVGVLFIIVSPTRSAVCFIQIVPFLASFFLHLSLSALVYCWFLDQRELFDSLRSFLPPLPHPIPAPFPHSFLPLSLFAVAWFGFASSLLTRHKYRTNSRGACATFPSCLLLRLPLDSFHFLIDASARTHLLMLPLAMKVALACAVALCPSACVSICRDSHRWGNF